MADESELIEQIAKAVFDGVKLNGGIHGAGAVIKLLGHNPTREHLYFASSYCRKMARDLPRHQLGDIKGWMNAASAIDQELTLNWKEYPER